MAAQEPGSGKGPMIRPLILLCSESSVKGIRPTQEDTHLKILDLHKHVLREMHKDATGTDAPEKGVLKPVAGSSAAPGLVRGGTRPVDDVKGDEEDSWGGGYLNGGTGELALFSVFDGHNGKCASEFCEKNMPHIMSKYVAPTGTIEPEDMQLAFVDADRTFLRSSSPNGGCTAVVSLLNTLTGGLVVGHVGDARCIVSRNGKAQVLTKVDHKPSAPTEEARIVAAGHTVKSGRLDGMLAVSRAIGDSMFKKDAYPIKKASKSKLNLTWAAGKPRRRKGKAGTGLTPKARRKRRKRKGKAKDAATPKAARGVVKDGGLDLSEASKMALTAVPDVAAHQLDIKDREDVVDGNAGDQFMVLACDGLFDVMSNQEVVDWVSERAAELHKIQSRRSRNRGPRVTGPLTAGEIFELMERCRAEDRIFNLSNQLAQRALDKGSNDNVTVLLVFFQKPVARPLNDDRDDIITRAWAPSFSLNMESWDSFSPTRLSAAAASTPSMTRVSTAAKTEVGDWSKKDPDDMDSEAEFSDESSGDNDSDVSDPESTAAALARLDVGDSKDDEVRDVVDSPKSDYAWNVPVRLRNVSNADVDASISSASALSSVFSILLGSGREDLK